MKGLILFWMSLQTTAFPCVAVLERSGLPDNAVAVGQTLEVFYSPLVSAYSAHPQIERWVDFELRFWEQVVTESLGPRRPVIRTHGGKI